MIGIVVLFLVLLLDSGRAAILGGRNVTQGRFNYVARISYYGRLPMDNGTEYNFHKIGTGFFLKFIADRNNESADVMLLLTAGHLFDLREHNIDTRKYTKPGRVIDYRVIYAGTIKIEFGSVNLAQATVITMKPDGSYTTIGNTPHLVRLSARYPLFTPRDITVSDPNYDMAVIELPNFYYNYVKENGGDWAELSVGDVIDPPLAGDICTVVGWGLVDKPPNMPATVLQEATVMVKWPTFCYNAVLAAGYANTTFDGVKDFSCFTTSMPDNVECKGPVETPDCPMITHGDSGGPVVCKRQTPQNEYLTDTIITIVKAGGLHFTYGPLPWKMADFIANAMQDSGHVGGRMVPIELK